MNDIPKAVHFLLLLLVFIGFFIASCSGGGDDGVSPSGPSLPAPPPNTPPKIVIQSPSDNALLWDVNGVVLKAQVTDVQDGNIGDDPTMATNLVWSSSTKDGDLGTGTPVFLNPFRLAKGTHTIRLVAKDKAGAVSEALV